MIRSIKDIVLAPVLLVVTLTTILSCSTESYSEYERMKVEFQNKIQGNIDEMQMWRTAIKVNVSVKSNYESTIRSFVTIDDELYITDQQYVPAGGGTVYLTVPQGRGNTVKIMAHDGHKTKTQSVILTGALEEYASFDLTATTPSGRSNSIMSFSRANSGFDPNEFATHDPMPSLYGNSYVGNSYYLNWDVTNWTYVCDVAAKYEDLEAEGEIVNYELVSRGPFALTLLCGYKGSSLSRTFGYYYHSQGTYSDIKFVDMFETHRYDFLDDKGLVQYKLIGDDNWYNLNFQIGDIPGNGQFGDVDRKGDNIFNTLYIALTYHSIISDVRGLTFNIDIPEGMHLGFYMREENAKGNDQYQKIIKLGLPKENLPYPFKGTNFSAKLFNINGTHRSWLHDNDGWYFMGMEDVAEGGDMDDNDMMFGITDPIGVSLPDIIDPDIDNMMEDYKLFPWTLAFEDVHRNPDFDFNDGIIQIIPDYRNEEACVKILAAGINERILLHYKMPDGTDNVLGEFHELLGKSADSFINTTSSYANTHYAEIDNIPWPKGFSMFKDASRFTVEIERGACEGNCTDYLSLAEEEGVFPQAILIAGNWNWPKERFHISDVFSNFSYWAREICKYNYWEWYKMPRSGTYVNY